MTRIADATTLTRPVSRTARPSTADAASRPKTHTLYRGMGLLELRMIVKYGVIVKFELPYDASFSYELDPAFVSANASSRRDKGREVLLRFDVPTDRFMYAGYAVSLVRIPSDIVPPGYVEELEKVLINAQDESDNIYQRFLQAKATFKQTNPTNGAKRILKKDPAFWSQPEAVAFEENCTILRCLPILIKGYRGTTGLKIACIDANTIDWDAFAEDNRQAFADSDYDRTRFEQVILPLIAEGKRKWRTG